MTGVVRLSLLLMTVAPLFPVPQKGSIALPAASDAKGSHGFLGFDQVSRSQLGSCRSSSVVSVRTALSSSPQKALTS